MTDAEFKELTSTLFNLGLADGDLGYRYWSKVIDDLEEMRAVYLAHKPPPPAPRPPPTAEEIAIFDEFLSKSRGME